MEPLEYIDYVRAYQEVIDKMADGILERDAKIAKLEARVKTLEVDNEWLRGQIEDIESTFHSHIFECP